MVRFHRYLTGRSSAIKVGVSIAKSGITISQLKALIKERKPVFGLNSVNVIFIGTNDIKLRRSYDEIRADFLSLVKYLKRQIPDDAQLIFVTLPKFPKMLLSQCAMDLIYNINKLIVSTQANKPIVRTVEWSFHRDVGEFFEKFYANNRKRVDLIHLNHKGFDFLSRRITFLVSGNTAVANNETVEW